MINTIRNKMYEALKNGDKEKKQVYSNILNALTNKAKENMTDNLSEADASSVIVKMVKTLQESIDTCPKNRTDILDKLTYEINIVKEYMPEQMGEKEIRSLIDNVLSEIGVSNPTAKDKGKIMKVLMPKVKGKADGKLVNSVLQSYFN